MQTLDDLVKSKQSTSNECYVSRRFYDKYIRPLNKSDYENIFTGITIVINDGVDFDFYFFSSSRFDFERPEPPEAI